MKTVLITSITTLLPSPLGLSKLVLTKQLIYKSICKSKIKNHNVTLDIFI